MKTEYLPNALHTHVIRGKVVGYLLCAEHPDGGSKARFFQHFGFSIDNWSALAETLRQHGLENKIVNAVESPFGCRYVVEGKIMSPDGRNLRLCMVWIVEKGESAPRVIMAHPA